MPLYQTTKPTFALRVSPIKHLDKRPFHSRWRVAGQDTSTEVVIPVWNIPTGTLGLFLRATIFYHFGRTNILVEQPVVELLVDQDKLLFRTQDVQMIENPDFSEEDL